MSDISRRSLLAGGFGAASVPPCTGRGVFGPDAGVQDGFVVEVEQLGAAGDGRANDGPAIQAAIRQAEARGGGTVRFRAGRTYLAPSNLEIRGRGVRLEGRGATLLNGRIVAYRTAADIRVIGLRVLHNTGKSDGWSLDISATGFVVEDVLLEHRPQAQSYQAYFRTDCAFGEITRLRTEGAEGVFVGGHDLKFTDCHLKARPSGGDDGYAIHAPDGATYNITIEGGVVEGHQAIASIGSAIGSSTGPSDHRHFVRNVRINGVRGVGAGGLILIKPGAITSVPYHHGLVEDIQMTNCSVTDPEGSRFVQGVWIWAARGAIVRNVRVRDCVVRARGSNNVVNVSGITIITRNEGVGPGRIEDIDIDNLQVTDVHGAAERSASAPGFPINWGCFIEHQDPKGVIGRVTIRNLVVDGTKEGGVYVGPGVQGPITLKKPTLRRVAANPAGVAGGGVYAQSPVDLRDPDIQAVKGPAIRRR